MVNGPVVRDLYDTHRGQFSLSSWPLGDIDELSSPQRKLITEIVDTYGLRSASWLPSSPIARSPGARPARACLTMPAHLPSSTAMSCAAFMRRPSAKGVVLPSLPRQTRIDPRKTRAVPAVALHQFVNHHARSQPRTTVSIEVEHQQITCGLIH
jgi:hypothetical protein